MVRLPPLLFCLLFLACTGLAAQPAAELVPLSRASIAPVLTRTLGTNVPPLSIRGEVDLDGKSFYIAEYQVLVEVSGEFVLPAADGMAFGVPVWGERVLVQYSAQHDIAALQALVDRSWADLQKRLSDSDVQPGVAAEIIARHGAIYAADQPASTVQAPVLVESRRGDRLRRYLVFSPTGMKVIAWSATGINPGNLIARVAWPIQKVEALSLALAVNLTGLDAQAARTSTFALPAGAPALLKPMSPFMEVRPAPGLALVQTHAVPAQVDLNEAVEMTAEFGRLRPAPAAAAGQVDALGKLRAAGEKLVAGKSAAEPLPAVLELDGPATARLMMLGLEAANEAIAVALERAVTPFSQRQ